MRSKIANEVIFILLVTIGVFYLISLLTHSPLEDPWSGDVILAKPVINAGGIFGAYLSDISISILGYVSYLLPVSLIWLGYNFHRDASKEKQNQFLFLLRLIAFFVMLIFAAALSSQYIAEPSGGYIGVMMHEMFFLEYFGKVSTVIYVGVIMVSFSIASSSSWKSIGSAMFGRSKGETKELFRQPVTTEKKREINKNRSTIVEQKTTNKKPVKQKTANKKPAKAEKTEKTETSNLFKSTSTTGLPDLSLLNDVDNNEIGYSEEELEQMSQQVELKLKDFGFDVAITAVTPGPVVTQFEISLAPGVKVSQIMNLNKDLARALLVESVRIVDVIPGKPVIGLEIPNMERELIGLKEVLSSEVFSKSKSTLTIALGKDINGLPVIADLAKTPHLLVGGATGMGKSIGLNAIILSILYKAKPDQVRLIMIDPKIVELASYADIPHLLTPVITNMNEAASALWWCVNEMERRYTLLAKFSVRNIESFNKKLIKAKKNGKPLLDPSFNAKTAKEGEVAPELETLPLIVIVIDEYADMLGALAQEDRAKSKRVEGLIVRIAQKARAAGIHLIVATQRPSVDVITGLIKSNIPTRISFKVSSKTDSRTILDQAGAEQLLGMGDMLYMTPGISHLNRVHGAFVEDNEIFRVVRHLKERTEPNYLAGVLNLRQETAGSREESGISGELDPLYDEAVHIVTSTRRASISSLQRRMRIGYNRAARIIEDMELSGIVSSMNSAGNREVLAPEPIDKEEQN
ncbi:MAG: DNA translocase FtsK 4TM domain-containing protein [Candidatus Thioglobus sp.]|jgi:S-DNA-T family DNA segregation ATPase FtsK/SpoIIIE|nr:DNA translocase FtsK 4TM domain-containing protein [Candidatus Thioglobus sp.]